MRRYRKSLFYSKFVHNLLIFPDTCANVKCIKADYMPFITACFGGQRSENFIQKNTFGFARALYGFSVGCGRLDRRICG